MVVVLTISTICVAVIFMGLWTVPANSNFESFIVDPHKTVIRKDSYVAPISSHLEFRHCHLSSNRVGNETIFMGGMVHFVELFCTGFSVATPLNPWV
jgi:hypothetical protein